HALDAHGIAGAARKVERQSTRFPRFPEPVCQCAEQIVRCQPSDHAHAGDCLAILDQSHGFLRRTYLAHCFTPYFCKVAFATSSLQFSSKSRLASASRDSALAAMPAAK